MGLEIRLPVESSAGEELELQAVGGFSLQRGSKVAACWGEDAPVSLPADAAS